MELDNELIIIGAFLGAGLLAYVIIPGLLVIWDRVLDHMEWKSTEVKINGAGGFPCALSFFHEKNMR